MSKCDYCDGPGGSLTFDNQACLPIGGKVQCIDWCIHHIVAALNAGGVDTEASCCGHGTQSGRIDLADGRVLVVESTHLRVRELESADNDGIVDGYKDYRRLIIRERSLVTLLDRLVSMEMPEHPIWEEVRLALAESPADYKAGTAEKN